MSANQMPALMPVYGRADLAFERGEGPYLFGTDGRRYLDFGSGIAVTALGHSHPRLVAALTEQVAKVWDYSNLFRIPGQERLAERLVDNSFADTVFFCNSGAEAVECALKMERRYHDTVGNPGRWRTLAFEGAFHGRTLATIAAGGNPKHLDGFDPPTHGFDRCAFNDLDAVTQSITDRTGAILIEPVQGEGGIRPADPAFLKGLRDLCDRHGILLIFDEVQSGMGRSGRLFAHEWAGVTPDILCAAKGLGGGFPVGACLATAKAAVGMTAGSHGSTFGGNPLAMAAGNAILDEMLSDGFFERVCRTSAYLKEKLTALVARHPKALIEARGQGLLLGLKCVTPNSELQAKLLKAGLIVVGASDNVLRLLPPLIVGEAECDEAIGILDSVLGASGG